MKTKQKKVKFSKGEINPKLIERQDLNILESSARYILNCISTPFGSIKTRGGTKNVAKVATNITAFGTPTITNSLGGTDANLYNLTALFVSDGIETVTDWFKYDFGSSISMYKVCAENIYFDFEAPVLSPVISNGVITGVVVNNAGKGLNNATVIISDVLGSGADISLTVNSSGILSGVTINDGGSGYSTKTRLTVNYTEPSDTVTLQGSTNDSDWDDLDTWAINKTNQDFVKTVSASYRYIRIQGSGNVKAVLNLYNVRVFESTPEADKIKLASFVFNLDQKYVIVLKNEEIKIYEDDALHETIPATGLLDIYFDVMKDTQAEDTMVFTHNDMRTKQLQRTLDWTDTFTANAGTDYITALDTNMYDGIKVQLATDGSLPGGLSLLTDYYTVNSSGKTAQLSLTKGGVPVDITSAGSGTHTLLVQGLYWDFRDFPWINIPYDAFGQEGRTQPASNITPSDVEGAIKITSSTSIFSPDIVGQRIEGNGGLVRITAHESGTVIYGYTIIPFYTTATITSGNWDLIYGYFAVWGILRGYPKTCQFYNQRLWFGGSRLKPNTIFASRLGQYNDFENIANYDNDGINQTIASEQIDEIVNIYPNRGIQVFTAGAEWIVPEGALTPNTFGINKNTSNGALANVSPVDIAGTTLFIEKNGKSLLGFVYNEDQNAFITSSLSLLTDLINNPVSMAVEHNSSQDIGNFLYIVLANGTMVTWCIVLDQKIQSPARHESANNGLIKDVVNAAGDTYILVNRKDVIYLEKLNQEKVDMHTIDSSLSASISGLDDYTGSFVTVYNDADGNFGNYYVVNGEITLSSTPTEAVNIGYTFNYAVNGNKIAIDSQTDNIEKRIAKATISTINTSKLTLCGQTLEQTDDIFDFYGVTGFERDSFYTLAGNSIDYMEILSMLLNINYGEK